MQFVDFKKIGLAFAALGVLAAMPTAPIQRIVMIVQERL